MEDIAVRILLFAILREKYGVKELEVKCDGTVRNLIENVANVLGEDFWHHVYDVSRNKVREDIIFTINGRNVRDIQGEIKLRQCDKVAIFPPIAGG